MSGNIFICGDNQHTKFARQVAGRKISSETKAECRARKPNLSYWPAMPTDVVGDDDDDGEDG